MSGLINAQVVAVLGSFSVASLVSGQLLFVDDLPGEYVDISSTGFLIPLGDESEAQITTTFGTSLFPAGDVVVGNNGGIAFDPSVINLGPSNAPIPSGEAFGEGHALLAFWDDLGEGGGVYWQEFDDRLVIQWHNRLIQGTEDSVAFQIQIFADDAPDRPLAQFLYSDIQQPGAGGGASATIGYQDGGFGFNAAQWSFNTSDAVVNGQILSLVPSPGSVLLIGLGLGAGAIRRRR